MLHQYIFIIAFHECGQDWAMAAFPRLREILGTARSQVWGSFWTSLHTFVNFRIFLPVCRLQFWVPWHPRSKRYKLRWGRVGTGENSAQIQQQFWEKRVCSESNHAGKESNVMAMPSCRGSMRSHHWGSIWSSLHAWFAQFLWHCHNGHKKHNQCFCVSKSALANKAISIWGRFCLVVPPFVASLSLVLPPWWLMPILPSRSLPRGEFLYVSYAAGLSFINLLDFQVSGDQ